MIALELITMLNLNLPNRHPFGSGKKLTVIFGVLVDGAVHGGQVLSARGGRCTIPRRHSRVSFPLYWSRRWAFKRCNESFTAAPTQADGASRACGV